ncbi:unnamed protein product, partial [marine sediment metagenome]
MITLSPEIITIIMFGALAAVLLTGYPLGTLMLATALLVGFLVKGPVALEMSYFTLFGVMTNYVLLAIPLFVFMGALLEASGLADRMYHALFLIMSGFRGGLAIGTV